MCMVEITLEHEMKVYLSTPLHCKPLTPHPAKSQLTLLSQYKSNCVQSERKSLLLHFWLQTITSHSASAKSLLERQCVCQPLQNMHSLYFIVPDKDFFFFFCSAAWGKHCR